MADSLAEISETCRCGASFKMTGALANIALLDDWRDSHRCLTEGEIKRNETPYSGSGSTGVVGFSQQWDHDQRSPVR